MRKLGLLGTSALGSVAFLGFSLALAAPAYAQTPEEGQPAPACPPGGANTTTNTRDNCIAGEVETESGQNANATTGPGEQIVVTGSRIRRPNLTSTVPITSVGPEEVLATADVSLGDALNDLPSLRSTFSQTNSTRFIGTAGLNWLDLRGLGTARTLVLVNGRRHITSTPGDYLVDVNTIPSDLVERIDIVTGGNSAIYGSDAVAGVVNFVLKRNFDGIRVRGQGAITDEADRGSYFGSITAGRNFAGDRGNVAIALEYAKANPLYFIDRPGLTGAFNGRCQFNLAEDTTDDGPTGSDGIPDQQFLCGVKNANISNGGLVSANATAAQCAASSTVLTAAQRAARCLPNGQPRFFAFDGAGNLIENVPGQDLRPFGSNNFVGGSGSTLRNTGQIAAGLQRYAANLLASFEVSPAFAPFIEAKYVHVDAVQQGQPSFFQGGTLGTFRCNNPFLSADALAQLQAIGRCANPATSTFALNRFNIDFGGRGEIHDRDTYRIVAGIGGDFNEDWRYEVAVNYGKLKTRLHSLNNLVIADPTGNFFSVYVNAIDAVRNSSGQIVCRINADTDPTNDDPKCVPLNVFGNGAPSQAALDYVNTTSTRREKATELVASAFISGDLSQLFEMPGGAVGFAVGAEYRRETAYSAFDQLTQNGATFLNAIQPFAPPALETKDAYAEIRVPILKDVPFARELTIEAAGRFSDYNIGSTGTVFAYNIGGTWAPVQDIRLRANYSKSVRAPTQSDLFSPFSQNFAFIADPCDILNINTGSSTRKANCIAAGVPGVNTAAGFNNVPARAASTSFSSGGNPALREETGKSLTIGGVFQPRWVPGFTVSVDYYDIKVKNLIAVLSAQQIINQCYDEADLNNQYCATVSRDPATGFFADPAVLSSGINFAAQRTKGIDFDVAYRRNFGNGHRLSLRAIATYIFELNNFTNPVNPTSPNRQLSELGDPQFAANFNATYGWGPYEFTYNLRYLGKQTIGTYEAQHSFNGNPPQNADLTAQVWYPAVYTHNIRMGFKVNEKFTFYGGVDNLFDRKPPFGLLGTGGGDPYDPIGRQFYFGATVDF